MSTLLDRLSALDIADLLLSVAARRHSATLTLEPMGTHHEATLLSETGAKSRVSLPGELGDAVAVRLGVVAGSDPWSEDGHLGRVKVRAGSTEADFMVVLRHTTRGWSAEVRRMYEADTKPPPTIEGQVPVEWIGPYQLEGTLGRGGMGVVYRATREGSGKPVAIKVLHPELASDPRIAAQFVREGRAASLSNHPGIVNVTDFGTLPDGRAFLVMELVEGKTLEKVLAEGPLPPARAVRIARRILDALSAAHVRGVFHRDLKPANIFLDDQDGVKIADFGSAKLDAIAPEAPEPPPEGAEARSSAVGTPGYMSPEHARGLPTDERTDIYAMGCILFKMLNGRVPFEGRVLMDVLFKQTPVAIPALASPHGPLPEVLERIVARSLARNLEERYANASEMRQDLDRALATLPLNERTRPR